MPSEPAKKSRSPGCAAARLATGVPTSACSSLVRGKETPKLAVHVLDESRAVESRRARAAPHVGRSLELRRLCHDVRTGHTARRRVPAPVAVAASSAPKPRRPGRSAQIAERGHEQRQELGFASRLPTPEVTASSGSVDGLEEVSDELSEEERSSAEGSASAATASAKRSPVVPAPVAWARLVAKSSPVPATLSAADEDDEQTPNRPGGRRATAAVRPWSARCRPERPG